MHHTNLFSLSHFGAIVRKSLVALAVTAATVGSANAAAVTVGAFGEQGWKADDVRNTSGVDLVGTNNTHAPKPGATPTLADDVAIAQQIQFVSGPAGSTYGGAVSIDGTASGNGKSNYSVIDTSTGFAPSSALIAPSFFADYEMYKQHTGAGSTLAFKLGIQSTNYGTGAGQSQNGFNALRSGESAWDLVLVHVPTIPLINNNTWVNVNLDSNSGTWTLFKQAGNAYYTIPGPIANPFSQTLADWALDPTFGSVLFGAGAKVSSIQFGLGSGQPIAVGYVDYLQTNILNGGDVVNFVPEPSTFVLSGLGMVGLLAFARKRYAAK